MRILIFTPATRASRTGNWATASRWQRLLRDAGHQVDIAHEESPKSSSAFDNAELLIGLHARRSGKTLIRFKKKHPHRAAIVALTGTDLYRDLSPNRQRKSATAIQALDICDQIILLQPLMSNRLRSAWRKKSSVVMMDALASARPRPKAIASPLKVCVVGHLRHEKDPLRTAMAVRKLPADVDIKVTHVGAALTPALHNRAEDESASNPNWQWRGSVNQSQVSRLMQSSHVLVNSSRVEGAPNVLFEAIGFGLPAIVSRIDGHVGVMGKAYCGYFPLGDHHELKKLMIRCLNSPSFYQRLCKSMLELQNKYKTEWRNGRTQDSNFKSNSRSDPTE